MSRPTVDLRSDTVTRPTPGMRRAIAEAEVGDDVLGDDPTVRVLEARFAELTGKEESLFFPSGTQANEAAIQALTRPGDEVLLEAGAHIFHYEGGGPAVLSGVQLRPLSGERGVLRPSQIAEAIRPRAPYFPRTSVICLENTHNDAGGAIYPVEIQAEVYSLARKHGLAVHLDGARIWNAHVATGIPLRVHGQYCDTLAASLCKGLGCPVGALLAGSAEVIDTTRRIRKRLGGGMRQVGILAAAGLYALDHHLDRLAEDHSRARRLAERLAEYPGLAVDPAGVETNIVLVGLEEALPAPNVLCARLESEGVLILPFGSQRLRAVTHLDVDDEGIERALRAFATVLG